MVTCGLHFSYVKNKVYWGRRGTKHFTYVLLGHHMSIRYKVDAEYKVQFYEI
jgi:hypothetical protein